MGSAVLPSQPNIFYQLTDIDRAMMGLFLLAICIIAYLMTEDYYEDR